MGRSHGRRSSASNTIPLNLNKLLGRSSIISAIFVCRFTASPSRSYFAVLGRVSVESTDRRACTTHQFLDPASSSLSELERYLKNIFNLKYLIIVYSQFCLGMLSLRLSWNTLMILMKAATCPPLPPLTEQVVL